MSRQVQLRQGFQQLHAVDLAREIIKLAQAPEIPGERLAQIKNLCLNTLKRATPPELEKPIASADVNAANAVASQYSGRCVQEEWHGWHGMPGVPEEGC